ncbi:hypothetical protein BV25DRAFT_1922688, partial [Artomyces pyxidatus]
VRFDVDQEHFQFTWCNPAYHTPYRQLVQHLPALIPARNIVSFRTGQLFTPESTPPPSFQPGLSPLQQLRREIIELQTIVAAQDQAPLVPSSFDPSRHPVAADFF